MLKNPFSPRLIKKVQNTHPSDGYPAASTIGWGQRAERFRLQCLGLMNPGVTRRAELPVRRAVRAGKMIGARDTDGPVIVRGRRCNNKAKPLCFCLIACLPISAQPYLADSVRYFQL